MEIRMVFDMVRDFMDSSIYMLLVGIVLLVAGVNGVLQPDSWALAMDPFGQLFNLLPNVVHQALGGLIALTGLGQSAAAADDLY